MSVRLPLVIFGTGSVARLAHHHATRELGLEVVGFAVDAQWRAEPTLLGLPVFEAESLARTHPPGRAAVFVALGYRSMPQRARSWQRFADAGWDTPSLVAPGAHVAATARLGPNCLVMPGAVVEPGTELGANNILWSNATICHDGRVGSHNFFASNATIGGEVTIGDRCFFGFSSTVLQQRTVGSDVLVGAAALLTTDAPGMGRYLGIPARRSPISAATGVCVS
ncbi:acetyltransferase [Acidovorax temperans]|uniref:acetyltransferase n=1 Tax=Acidovorax temperans TaxID=80878 RepID=UPI00289F294E|nr:acetyltransferase [Acidovorax temperans]